jgi:hypothetical protein
MRINEHSSGLLIRGFGVRVPGGAPVLTWCFTPGHFLCARFVRLLAPCVLAGRLFFSFVVNMARQYAQIGRWRDYNHGEVAYIILSLTAKSLLAWLIFANVQPHFTDDGNPSMMPRLRREVTEDAVHDAVTGVAVLAMISDLPAEYPGREQIHHERRISALAAGGARSQVSRAR